MAEHRPQGDEASPTTERDDAGGEAVIIQFKAFV